MTFVLLWSVKVGRLSAGVLLALMVYGPTLWTGTKYVLLALALGGAAAEVVNSRGREILAKPVLISFAVALAAGCSFTAFGLRAGNVGAGVVSRIYVFDVIFYGALVILARRRDDALLACRIASWSAVAACAYGWAFLFSQRGWLPLAFSELPLLGKQIYVQLPDSTLPTASFPFFSTLLFAVPCAIALLTVAALRGGLRGLDIAAAMIVTVLGSSLVLVTGRRALIIVIVATPVFVCGALFAQRLRVRHWWRLAVFGLGAATLTACMCTILLISPATPRTYPGGPIAVTSNGEALVNPTERTPGAATAAITHQLQSGFDPAAEGDAAARAQQADVLSEYIRHRPILGYGFGATTPGYERSHDQPWGYELSYLVLLFNVGLVGSAIYLALLALAPLSAIRATRGDPLMAGWGLAVAVGAVGLLAGNATNPYLAKFDALWTVFLPAAIANAALLARRHRQGLGGPTVPVGELHEAAHDR